MSGSLGNPSWSPYSALVGVHLELGPGSVKCAPQESLAGELPGHASASTEQGPHGRFPEFVATCPRLGPSSMKHTLQIPCRGIPGVHVSFHMCTDICCDKVAKIMTRNCHAAYFSICNKVQGHLYNHVLSCHKMFCDGTGTRGMSFLQPLSYFLLQRIDKMVM